MSAKQRVDPEREHELKVEQAHVDRVYAELVKADQRAASVAADGLARGRTERAGDVRDEEATGLFERDALVYRAAVRRHALQTEHEGLVFGRLDIDEPVDEIRYIGRLGVRDDDYEPLVIDWRAPAAGPFYRATPVDRLGVIRRRVLRCSGADVVGIEDDLMVPEAPDGMTVLGDGALIAALTRSRGARMRDIVATIQAHQDEAIRAPARGVTEITGGPGTGKTVVALHRAAYLLYADRRRFESGGILVIGPSAAYTAYIERVLPSLGEDSVSLRSVGDVVDAVTATRLDAPDVARLKGSLAIREVLARVARARVPESPHPLRVMVMGEPIRLDESLLDRARSRVLRGHQRNLGTRAALHDLAEAAFAQTSTRPERPKFHDTFIDHGDVREFMKAWWPQLDPRDVLLWLADDQVLARHSRGLLTGEQVSALAASWRLALETGEWSVADVALIDDLASRLGPVQEDAPEERGFYEIEEFDDLASYGVTEVQAVTPQSGGAASTRWRTPRERLLHGVIGRPRDYAHILVDEAQDLSPMQWRMLGRRSRSASWTVVGDAAQSSWPSPVESERARAEAYGRAAIQRFHMDTNYRNAREIFEYASHVIRRAVPDADIPDAVRETGVDPADLTYVGSPASAVDRALDDLLSEVDGSVAVVTPQRHRPAVAALHGRDGGRVVVVDPMSTKGLEYDATIVLDPDEIVAESPGGVRVLYVALTRAAHRMTVLRPEA